MLNERNYFDGRYDFNMKPHNNVNYIVSVEDKMSDVPSLKEYVTEDDDTALAVFESMVEIYMQFGEVNLINYKVAEQLQSRYSELVTVIKE